MATTWYYYDEKGDKIEVTGGRLKGLAKTGVITPETIVETADGKKARAGKVKGLTFIVPGATQSEPIPSEPAQSVESESYGLAAPPPKPSPFTAPMPKAMSASVTAPSETANPFTAPPPKITEPTVANPFTASIPVVAKPTVNPFTATMPTTSQATPQSVPMPIAEGGKSSHWTTLIGILALLIVGGTGWAITSGGGGFFGGKKTASAAKAYVEAVIREEASILDLDSGWSTDDFHGKNPATALRDKKDDGVLEAKPGFEHTWKLASELLMRKLTLKIYTDNGMMSEFKNLQRTKLRELIGLSIEEIERAGEQSNVFDNWKSGGSVAGTVEQTGVNAKDEKGQTKLHRAAYLGNSEEVKSLLAQGADVNAKDEHNNTPLHWAAYFLKVDTAKLLISNGANVNVKNDFDKTPLDRIDEYTDLYLNSQFFQRERAELRAYLISVGARSGK